MSRDGFEFGDRAPTTRYKNADGSITNFKTGPGSVPIGEGVSSSKNSTATPGGSKPGEGVYQDAILRQAQQDDGGKSRARTGSDQVARLRYPLDPQEYEAEVIFEPIKPESIIDDLSSLLDGSGNKPVFPDPEDDYDAGPAERSAARKKKEREAEDRLNARGEPDPRTSDPYAVKEKGQAFQGQRDKQIREDIKAFEGKTGAYTPKDRRLRYEQIGRQVRLYLPQAIQITDGVQVGPIDLGVAGAGVEAALGTGVSSAVDIAQQALAGADITSIVDVFKSNNLRSTAGAFAAQRAARLVGQQGVAGAISRGTKVQVNPNTRSLFRAVNLREFSFTFKMIGTSQAEAESIKAIIAFFRRELYPEQIQIGIGDVEASLAYRMPNLFDIRFLYKNSLDIATRIKPCYLRNFTATYNPSGMGMHADGNFLETDIVMSFVEDTTLSRQDINSGY